MEGNPQIKNILPEPDVITEALSPGQRLKTIEPGINYTRPGCVDAGVRGARESRWLVLIRVSAGHTML